jgi:hypothetical protein
MQLPARWTWTVKDGDGASADSVLNCEANDDWIYGLGTGYVGSFRYSGSYHGRSTHGTGYVEYIGTCGPFRIR